MKFAKKNIFFQFIGFLFFISISFASSPPSSEIGDWVLENSSYTINAATITVHGDVYVKTTSTISIETGGNLKIGRFWTKRIPINISTNFNPDIPDDYQIWVPTTAFSAALWSDIKGGTGQADLDDVRFVSSMNATGYWESCPYWIEPDTTAPRGFWVKISSLNQTNSNMYMYYGNADAVSASNGDATFEFFDDFLETSLDTNKWTEYTPIDAPANTEVVNGNYKITTSAATSSGSGIRTLGKYDTFGPDLAILSRYTMATETNWCGSTYVTDGGGNQLANNGYPISSGGATNVRLVTGATIGSWIFDPVAGTFYNYELKWTSSKVKLFINDVEKDTSFTNVYTGTDAYIDWSGRRGYSGSAGAISKLDLIRVRKYSYPEPTVDVDVLGNYIIPDRLYTTNTTTALWYWSHYDGGTRSQHQTEDTGQTADVTTHEGAYAAGTWTTNMYWKTTPDDVVYIYSQSEESSTNFFMHVMRVPVSASADLIDIHYDYDLLQLSGTGNGVADVSAMIWVDTAVSDAFDWNEVIHRHTASAWQTGQVTLPSNGLKYDKTFSADDVNGYDARGKTIYVGFGHNGSSGNHVNWQTTEMNVNMSKSYVNVKEYKQYDSVEDTPLTGYHIYVYPKGQIYQQQGSGINK